jgi:hypothetical protein
MYALAEQLGTMLQGKSTSKQCHPASIRCQHLLWHSGVLSSCVLPLSLSSASAYAASGFGKAFMNASNKQWGVGYMQQTANQHSAAAVAAAAAASGFGKAFMNAGNKQWGVGYMQQTPNQYSAAAVAAAAAADFGKAFTNAGNKQWGVGHM